jgi:glutamate synthase domain-containing protein 2
MIDRIRWKVFYAVIAACAACLLLALHDSAWLWGAAGFAPLVGLGTWDVLQTRHAVLRNFPLLGHLRYLLEDLGPELNQYFVEGDLNGRPFNRDQRSLVYQRAKSVIDETPFGTQLDVYSAEYQWINHSIAPRDKLADAPRALRIQIGGPQCGRPYSASVFNISAMSFGSLGAPAVLALNHGAKLGGFAQDTGEGGLSPYHREPGGDLIWELGTGYFSARTADGRFDPVRFAENARSEQVRMIELKLSQGAKPGKGGILPGRKVTPEIARTRGVPAGVDCVSPPRHSAFGTPREMLEFLARLRELSGGKPVGFKLCVGHPSEILGLCKAMLASGIYPDFIVVDGGEGGTGAAPVEFTDHVGAPLREGLVLVHNALVGSGLREHVRIGASGKLLSGFDIACAMALGADWANSARGFMLALGCLQSLRCHTNKCPTGVATQDKRLQRGLVVPDKARRVQSYHAHTVDAIASLVAAAGLSHPRELRPAHILLRTRAGEVRSLDQVYGFLKPGELAAGGGPQWLRRAWRAASPDSFVEGPTEPKVELPSGRL